jgi:signal transduction histidine kinase
VRWDLVLAARLLRELLLNAVRFSPGGGRVSLRARAEAARVLLTVEDEGPGIPARQCEAVFERFQQLGDVLTEKPRGAGLGLPICRAIAVLHGGWIRAEPRAPAPGARFVLELPIDASAGWRSEEAPEDILAMLRP